MAKELGHIVSSPITRPDVRVTAGFLCLEALAVALLRHFEARGCRQGAIWSVDNARQKETPAKGRGSKTSPGSVTLFPPREAFFLTHSLSLPNWHCDSRWWTACRLSSASLLSPGISSGSSSGWFACFCQSRDRRSSENVVLTAILVQDQILIHVAWRRSPEPRTTSAGKSQLSS